MNAQNTDIDRQPAPRKRRCVICYVTAIGFAALIVVVLGLVGTKPSRLTMHEALIASHGEDLWLVVDLRRVDYRGRLASPPAIFSYDSLLVVHFDPTGVREVGEHKGEQPYYRRLHNMKAAVSDGRLFLTAGSVEFGTLKVWQWTGEEFMHIAELPEDSVEISMIREHLSLSNAASHAITDTDFAIDFRGEQGKEVYLRRTTPGREWEHHVLTLELDLGLH